MTVSWGMKSAGAVELLAMTGASDYEKPRKRSDNSIDIGRNRRDNRAKLTQYCVLRLFSDPIVSLEGGNYASLRHLV